MNRNPLSGLIKSSDCTSGYATCLEPCKNPEFKRELPSGRCSNDDQINSIQPVEERQKYLARRENAKKSYRKRKSAGKIKKRKKASAAGFGDLEDDDGGWDGAGEGELEDGWGEGDLKEEDFNGFGKKKRKSKKKRSKKRRSRRRSIINCY